jgi:hypothetical protein
LGSSIVSVYECDEDDESDGRVSSITGAGRWLVSLSLWAMLSRLRINLETVFFLLIFGMVVRSCCCLGRTEQYHLDPVQ